MLTLKALLRILVVSVTHGWKRFHIRSCFFTIISSKTLFVTKTVCEILMLTNCKINMIRFLSLPLLEDKYANHRKSENIKKFLYLITKILLFDRSAQKLKYLYTRVTKLHISSHYIINVGMNKLHNIINLNITYKSKLH